MGVVDVVNVIVVVRDGVFPEAALPDAAFSFAGPAAADGFAGGDGSGEPRIDQAPARAEIVVAHRQRDDGVQVVGHDAHGVDVERVFASDVSDGFAQCANVVGEQIQPAIQEVQREEITAAVDAESTVVRHEISLAMMRSGA